MDWINNWKMCDELKIWEAVLLILNCDPDEYHKSNDESSYDAPKGYQPLENAIFAALKKNTIEGVVEMVLSTSEERMFDEIVPDSIVIVESLKKWLISKKRTDSVVFFPEDVPSEILDSKHPRYSPKLAAAVAVWEYLDSEEKLKATTPKQAAIKWLHENAREYDLLNRKGDIAESVIKDIATIVNWCPEGGAPKTPDGTK